MNIEIKCSKCGVYIDLDCKYCTHCGHQMKERVIKEKEVSQEEMQKQIEETKEEAHETVKSKKSKYKQERDFIHRVSESVGRGYKLIGKQLKETFKPKEKEKSVENKVETKKSNQKKNSKK